jgi:hypothetical protein
MKTIFGTLAVLAIASCGGSSSVKNDLGPKNDLGGTCNVVGSWSYVSDLNFNDDDGINLASDGNFTVWQGEHEGGEGTWSVAAQMLTLHFNATLGTYALSFGDDCVTFQASSARDCSALGPLFVAASRSSGRRPVSARAPIDTQNAGRQFSRRGGTLDGQRS